MPIPPTEPEHVMRKGDFDAWKDTPEAQGPPGPPGPQGIPGLRKYVLNTDYTVSGNNITLAPGVAQNTPVFLCLRVSGNNFPPNNGSITGTLWCQSPANYGSHCYALLGDWDGGLQYGTVVMSFRKYNNIISYGNISAGQVTAIYYDEVWGY